MAVDCIHFEADYYYPEDQDENFYYYVLETASLEPLNSLSK
jgi:hypothetical protein